MHSLGGLVSKAIVIFNPAKVREVDPFKESLGKVAQENGFELEYIETAEEDPGFEMAAQAREAKPDLVIVAGGDGTVRVVTTELRETGIPVAILPAGTTNLLARNLGISMNMDEAIQTAFAGRTLKFDLVKVTLGQGKDPKYFTGMAGVGIDAEVMHGVEDKLKKLVGPGAYVMSFLQQVGSSPCRVKVTIDDTRVLKRKTTLLMVGNTAELTGGVKLFPEADPTDGSLELLLGAPTGFASWLKVIGGVLTGKRKNQEMEYFTGKKFTVEIAQPTVWEMDGDAEDPAQSWTFEVLPGALSVCAGELSESK
ncbi:MULTISPECIES: diacylglycerol kinase family protein [Mobiluncus]|uniref:diacylglycerol/lipid kinase family protein n=1 Tax=Mobiluncus TaxID=2050 RepID=UPI00258C60A4|nr:MULTISPECIES: diacylglycerol kinase family protein [Mobiluncus]